MLGGVCGIHGRRSGEWPWRPWKPAHGRQEGGLQGGVERGRLRGVLEGRSRAEHVIKLEGRPPCRPIFVGRSPVPIPPTKPRRRAEEVGADGASPSKGFRCGDLGGQSHTYTYSIKQTGGEVIRCVCQAFRRGASGGVESGWHKILIGNAFGNLRLWSNEGEWVTTA